MSFVKYSGLETPNQVIEKMVEYIKSVGYTVISDLSDDLNIYDMSSSDGKKFVFKNRKDDSFIILRTANGKNIFGTTDDSAMSTTIADTDTHYEGIGMVVSEGYSAKKRWYNQYRVPVTLKTTNNAKDVLGVFMPVPTDNYYSYTLYCNNVTSPTDTLIFSLVKDSSLNKYNQTTHLLYADIEKYDAWTGGSIISGSANRYMIGSAYACYDEDVTVDSHILPILSSGKASNTFLRIDIDDAITDARGNIFWASSGSNNETGKKLSLPIRTGSSDSNFYGNGLVPHYWYLQSHSRLDCGRNINTLNGITINLPIYFAVLVDPDLLDNYAAVGTISGIYFVSTLNMQTAGTYEMSYPASDDLCQVFPMGKRRGAYGFDGVSIRQITA